MNQKSMSTWGLLLGLALLATAVQAVEPIHSGAAGQKKMDHLLVYGDGFAFSVKEPPGWAGDTDAAKKFGTNIVFFPVDAAARAAHVTIRVRVNDKVNEDTAADLAADRDGYKRQFPKVQFGELKVRHSQYATFPEIFFQDGHFYEYVAYLNPGPKYQLLLSVAMSKEEAAATSSELEAFSTVLESLQLLSDNLTVIQPGR
jgi:hypothetical protein